MPTANSDLVGIGLYSVAEAARLARVQSAKVRRWLEGYSFRREGKEHNVLPVLIRQLPRLDHTVGLGFLDLLEVQFLDRFRSAGVSWNVIRKASVKARDRFQVSHPFCHQRFRTDGRSIFQETIKEEGENELLNLVTDQFAFHRIVLPNLYHAIVFSQTAVPARWFPAWPKTGIVVDPKRCFGRPVLAREGIPTDLLAAAAQAEGSHRAAARWFDVPVASVRQAVAFERSLDA